MKKYLKIILTTCFFLISAVAFAIDLKGHTEINNATIKEPDGCWPIKSSYHDMGDIDGNTRGTKHLGIDIVAPKGTPVLAAADGKVIYAGRQIVGGKAINIAHGKDIYENIVIGYYIHLNEINVIEEQLVKRGEIIGKVGSTGTGMPKSNTAHLHFETKLLKNEEPKITLGWIKDSTPINPSYWLNKTDRNLYKFKKHHELDNNQRNLSELTYPVQCNVSNQDINQPNKCIKPKVISIEITKPFENLLSKKVTLNAETPVQIISPYKSEASIAKVGFEEFLILHTKDNFNNIVNVMFDGILIIAHKNGVMQKNDVVAEIIPKNKNISYTLLVSNVDKTIATSAANNKILTSNNGGGLDETAFFSCITQ